MEDARSSELKQETMKPGMVGLEVQFMVSWFSA